MLHCRLFNSGRVACAAPAPSNTTVIEYTLQDYDPNVSLLHFQSVSSLGLTGPLHTGCDAATQVTAADGSAITPPWVRRPDPLPSASAAPHVTINHTVYRVSRFDITNPYEAMHSYINAFIAVMTLRLDTENLQIVFEDDFRDAGTGTFDSDFWTMIAPNHPQVRSFYLPIVGRYLSQLWNLVGPCSWLTWSARPPPDASTPNPRSPTGRL